MPPMDSPWQIVVEEIKRLKNEGIEHILIDFHAEATAEKICFSKFLANEFNNEENALVKGFFGTHTHVQTADEQLLPNGTAYITDLGMNEESALQLVKSKYKDRFKLFDHHETNYHLNNYGFATVIEDID